MAGTAAATASAFSQASATHTGTTGKPDARQLPHPPVHVAKDGRVVREPPVLLDALAPRQLERRVTEPRAARPDAGVVRDRAHAEQDVVGQPLPRRDDHVVAEERARADVRWAPA